MSYASHDFHPARQHVSSRQPQQDQNGSDRRHRPISRATFFTNEEQDSSNRQQQNESELYYYSDDFQHLPVLQFPIRQHFHVSKEDRRRELDQVFGEYVRTLSLVASITILAIAAVLGGGAVVAMERAEMHKART